MPGGHLAGKGNQQHHVADHGGIERIEAEPAIEVLAGGHGKRHADQYQPPRRMHRQTEREQPGGDDRAQIGQVRHDRFVTQFENPGLEGERKQAGQHNVDQDTRTEIPGVSDGAGDQGDDDLQHQTPQRFARRDVG